MIEQSALLNSIEGITHGFFTRQNGFSKSPFASLNCSTMVGDSLKRVNQNRQYAMRVLALNKNLIIPSIAHTNNAIFIDDKFEAEFLASTKADALITAKDIFALAVTYADCLPVLLAASDGSLVAAVHAGWRGLLNGVLEQTIAKIIKNSPKTSLVAAIGPAISKNSFVFGGEGLRAFEQNWPGMVFKHPEGKCVDLVGVAKAQLEALGISQVEKVGGYTDLNEEKYFSYRRDQGQTGRHIAIIARQKT